MDKLLNAAKVIKEWCSTKGIYNEEKCPFFRGYKQANGINVVICELNKAQTSPCNWELE